MCETALPRGTAFTGFGSVMAAAGTPHPARAVAIDSQRPVAYLADLISLILLCRGRLGLDLLLSGPWARRR